ncbi:EscR/YscR/HrcR family type III secretion system export apparatus protein [Pantoea agglomerans]|uniref:EscR/YscR/HrcR family type III secretion system export apparatus protein n=1 Tax=Enterobacter agglomerans TaxID=549 RepID=UPI0013B8FBF4|nr:EscR/YscR/HrcR family type III secretion system export apparatus protein [Pantoea agglomerans]NEG59853.1 EscR/YscR/HrcR family type III secretion system export apparatus protein [Pantoea agglomerans]NEG98822.1 EscR/YscR/HrcR family type III secretion system export apparatus protein [Pantoea agglomerans]NEH05194.1 EscR/YscR/HrcR family type III secretion system export apparatus protein [Pantoea agglomerans]NEH16183.1 EscR/YscR/HrcR family type III secretion system export apparatus protein [Pa
MFNNDITLIALLSFFSLLPFIIAGGTCYIKFSIVLSMVRNAIGVQQVPSTLTLNGIALILSAFVMMPVCQRISGYIETHHTDFNNSSSVSELMDEGLSSYRDYLVRYSDHQMIKYFNEVQLKARGEPVQKIDDSELSSLPLMTLMPAYALSEIQSAFKIAFYLYVPFVVIDMVISSILLALGMMMMSPVTISIPIKLILFVAMNGWGLLTKGLISQYTELMIS